MLRHVALEILILFVWRPHGGPPLVLFPPRTIRVLEHAIGPNDNPVRCGLSPFNSLPGIERARNMAFLLFLPFYLFGGGPIRLPVLEMVSWAGRGGVAGGFVPEGGL